MQIVLGENGIIKKASEAAEITKKANVLDKVSLMLAEQEINRNIGSKTLKEFIEEKIEKGEIDEIIEETDTEITIEVDGYEIIIDKETLKILDEPTKVGGVRPTFEVQITKIDGTELTSGETEKALTINITNIAEFESYTIQVQDENGKTIAKEENIVGNQVRTSKF